VHESWLVQQHVVSAVSACGFIQRSINSIISTRISQRHWFINRLAKNKCEGKSFQIYLWNHSVHHLNPCVYH